MEKLIKYNELTFSQIVEGMEFSMSHFEPETIVSQKEDVINFFFDSVLATLQGMTKFEATFFVNVLYKIFDELVIVYYAE